jgi:adenylate kinase
VPRIVLLGPPGAGKGTQGKRLADFWKVPHIASGDLLRKVIEAGGPLADAVRVINEGKHVSDEIVSGIVFAELDAVPGFVLDGYPRNVSQAETLDRHLAERGVRLDAVIALQVGDDEVLRRLAGRLTCPNCGETYHIPNQPPRVPGTCDRCGASLMVREDDKPEGIRTRLALYHERTEPLLSYYRAAGLLREVDATGTEDEVFARCLDAVRDTGNPVGETANSSV